jgi:hypothetical protein
LAGNAIVSANNAIVLAGNAIVSANNAIVSADNAIVSANNAIYILSIFGMPLFHHGYYFRNPAFTTSNQIKFFERLLADTTLFVCDAVIFLSPIATKCKINKSLYLKLNSNNT